MRQQFSKLKVHVERAARKHPVAHRQTIACHGQPDDNLRRIRATIFRHAPFARGLVDFRSRGDAPFHQVLLALALIHLVDFKM